MLELVKGWETRMIKRIVYLFDCPLSYWDKRFGMDIFRENGFDVEVWEASKAVLGEVAEKLSNPGGTGEFLGHVKVFDMKTDLIEALKQLDASTLLLPLNQAQLGYKTKWIYDNLGCPYGIIAVGAVPHHFEGEEKIRKLRMRLAKIFQKGKLIAYIKYKSTPLFLRFMPYPAIVIIDSYDNINFKNTIISAKTIVVHAHTFDYDAFLDENDKPVKSVDDYMVFLDEWAPFHTDNYRFSIKPPVTADEYYGSLCNFFELIEAKLNMPVKIAAHPRSFYNTEFHVSKDWYKGREIVYGKTVELVRYSKLIINHSSTAINYVVLYKKPVLFITTDQLERENFGIHIAMNARLFNKNVINIDDVDSIKYIDSDEVMKIDDDKYNEYREKYIKMPGTSNKKLFQIMADAIKANKI
jgi:hypothetical protein